MTSILQAPCTKREFLQISFLAGAGAVLEGCGKSAPAPTAAPLNESSPNVPLPSAGENPLSNINVLWQEFASSLPETKKALLKKAVAASIGASENYLNAGVLDSAEIQHFEALLGSLETYNQALHGVEKDFLTLGLLRELRNYAGIVLYQGNYAKFVETAYVFNQLASGTVNPDGSQMTEVIRLEEQMNAMMQICFSQQEGQLAIIENILGLEKNVIVETAIDALDIHAAVWREYARERGQDNLSLFNENPQRYQQASTMCQAYNDNQDTFREIMSELGYGLPENPLAIESHFRTLEQSPALYQQFIDRLTDMRASSQSHLIPKNDDPADWENLRLFIEQSLVHQTLQMEKKCQAKENQNMIVATAVFGVFKTIDRSYPDFINQLLTEPLTDAKIQQIIQLGVMDKPTREFFQNADPQTMQNTLDQLRSNPDLDKNYYLWALAEMMAESFLEKDQKVVVNEEQKDIWVNLYKVDPATQKKTLLMS